MNTTEALPKGAQIMSAPNPTPVLNLTQLITTQRQKEHGISYSSSLVMNKKEIFYV